MQGCGAIPYFQTRAADRKIDTSPRRTHRARGQDRANMDDPLQPTCCAGMQAMGTLLGTMFGFVSAALLTPIHGGERADGLPAAPGVVVGSSLGVLAAHSAGEGDQPLQQLASLLILSVAAAAATTAACSWLVGDILQNGGSAGIMILATVASLGSTAAFTLLKHSMLLRRAAALGAFDDRDDPDVLPRTHADRGPLIGPKEV